jgi:predicted Zn-dependent protease
MRRVLALLSMFVAVTAASAQQSPQTYLSAIASDPASTGGQPRLLHYLSQDMPIAVYVPPAPQGDGQAMRDAVIRAVKAWQQAAPDVLTFVVVGQDTPDAITVTWRELTDKVASYRYAFTIDAQNQYRFHTTEVLLDPRYQPDQIYRYALLAFGQAVGMLGRSPYPGDALSATPSGSISQRDVATLRALYAVPSGTVLER